MIATVLRILPILMNFIFTLPCETSHIVIPALWISLKHREIRKLAQVHTVGGNLGFEPRQTCCKVCSFSHLNTLLYFLSYSK